MFLFEYSTKIKRTTTVAAHPFERGLTLITLMSIRSDGGEEFIVEVVDHVCRWLKADINYGASNYPRGQEPVKRAGAWIHDVLSKLYRSWLKHWEKYVGVVCWIKRTMPDPLLPKELTPFHVLYGRNLRTQLDAPIQQLDGYAGSEGQHNFMENQRHTFLEVRNALRKRKHRTREWKDQLAVSQQRSGTQRWYGK